MFSKYQSVNGNRCAQVFANNSFFIAAYPMSSKDQAGLALGEFINEFGIMNELVMDGAAEQIGKNTNMMKWIRKYDIIHHKTEPEQHNQNRAESAIRELKKKWFRVMVKHKVPKRLWDYGLHWCCDISQRTPNSVFSLEGRTPIEQMTGETPDISKYLDFSFYDYVLVHKNAGLRKQILCRWLGVAHRVGSQMAYYVIKANSQVIARSSVQQLTNLELATEKYTQLCKRLDNSITSRLKDANHIVEHGALTQPQDWRTFDLDADPEFIEEFQKTVTNQDLQEEDDLYGNDINHDSYVGLKVAIPTMPDEPPRTGHVRKRIRTDNGMPLGIANKNPLLDTQQFEVEFDDGQTLALTANQIAEKSSHV